MRQLAHEREWVRDCERDPAFDPLRRGDAGIICDRGAPVVANQFHGSPRRPAVDQREHVAGEGCEVERPRSRGRRVTAKPGCDDVTSTAAELGKEGLRDRRMVREAVQDNRRLTIGSTTLQRMKGAVWQVEGDVFELHVCLLKPASTAGRRYQPSRRAILPW